MNELLTQAQSNGEAWGRSSASLSHDFAEAVNKGIEFLGPDTYDSAYGDAFIIGIGKAFGYYKVR
jgi:hypothetical protein